MSLYRGGFNDSTVNVPFLSPQAQHIKNFKSQRWQTLLNFNSQCRLLLTGTPLQNSLMELWSLMHFLMPAVFSSHSDFKEWFSNPLTGMVEGSQEYNASIVKRLHQVREWCFTVLNDSVLKLYFLLVHEHSNTEMEYGT